MIMKIRVVIDSMGKQRCLDQEGFQDISKVLFLEWGDCWMGFILYKCIHKYYMCFHINVLMMLGWFQFAELFICLFICFFQCLSHFISTLPYILGIGQLPITCPRTPYQQASFQIMPRKNTEQQNPWPSIGTCLAFRKQPAGGFTAVSDGSVNHLF